MLVAIIVYIGSWYYAGKVKSGWWMLLIVPACTLLAALVSFLVGAYMLGDGPVVGVLSALRTVSLGLPIGFVLASIRLWLTRKDRANARARAQ